MGVKYGKISSTFTGSGTNTGNLLYFYHPDHLGSSSLITGSGGDVLQHIEYVPYGEVFIEEKNANWNTPYKFNAKELDEETGLYYYGARYYDPKTSVWISVDPLAEEMPNISSYNYCFGNPVILIDPDGKQPKRTRDIAFGAVIGWLIPPRTATTPLQIMQKDRIHAKFTHTVLDVGGMVPVVGEAFDGLNGFIYLGENDKLNAGFSFGACVPILGWASTGAKWANKMFKLSWKVDAKFINKAFVKAGLKAAYDESSEVVQGVLKNEEKFVRVHTEKNKVGKWMMKESEIEGLTPAQIKDKFALPELPTHISDVNVPAGTSARVGTAGKIDGFGNGGGAQVELLQNIPTGSFTNTRKL